MQYFEVVNNQPGKIGVSFLGNLGTVSFIYEGSVRSKIQRDLYIKQGYTPEQAQSLVQRPFINLSFSTNNMQCCGIGEVYNFVLQQKGWDGVISKKILPDVESVGKFYAIGTEVTGGREIIGVITGSEERQFGGLAGGYFKQLLQYEVIHQTTNKVHGGNKLSIVKFRFADLLAKWSLEDSELQQQYVEFCNDGKSEVSSVPSSPAQELAKPAPRKRATKTVATNQATGRLDPVPAIEVPF